MARAEARSNGTTSWTSLGARFHRLDGASRRAFLDAFLMGRDGRPRSPVARLLENKREERRLSRTQVLPAAVDDIRREQCEGHQALVRTLTGVASAKAAAHLDRGGIAVVLSLFDDSPPSNACSCPRRRVTTPSPMRTGRLRTATAVDGRPHRDRQGVPPSTFRWPPNPGLARLIGTLLKRTFNAPMLARIPQVTSHHATGGRCCSCATSTRVCHRR